MAEDSDLEELKEYHNNGKIRKQEFYRNGSQEGESKQWYENGQMMELEYYRNGKREGQSKTWYDDGQLLEYLLYRDGEMEEYKTWHFNGQVRSQGFYQDGHREGKYFFRHNNGFPDELGTCKNGVLAGEQRRFYSDGTVMDHIYYKSPFFGVQFTFKNKRVLINLRRLLCFPLWNPDISCFIIPDLAGLIFGR